MDISTIFVISSGRSGTAYLCDLWKLAEKHRGEGKDGGVVVAAKHEPLPVCCALPMERWNEGYSKAMATLVEAKRGLIRDELAQASLDSTLAGRRLIYVETNAQFIKGFGWEWMRSTPLAEQGRVGVIVLTRDKEAVVQSFLSNCEAPGFDSFANVWNIRPHCARSYSDRRSSNAQTSSSPSSSSSSSGAPNQKASRHDSGDEIDVVDVDEEEREEEEEEEEDFIHHDESDHHHEEDKEDRFTGLSTPEAAIRWQLEEIEARTQLFKQRYPAAPMYRVDLAELNDAAKVLEMFSFFGVSHALTPELLAEVVNRPVNTGAERCHSRSSASAEHALLRPASELPRDPLSQARLVEAAVDYILREHDEVVQRHASKRRAILETGLMSCMVAAKSIIDEVYLPMCTAVLEGRHCSFSDVRWNIMCRLVQRLDANDPMFRFVTEITACRFRLDGLNGDFERQWLARSEERDTADGQHEHLHGNNNEIDSKDSPFIVTVTGATGKLGQCLVPALLQHLLPHVQRLELRLLVLPTSIKRAQALIADVEDALLTSPAYATVTATADVHAAFTGTQLAVLLASAPRLEHYDRLHLAPQQVDIYSHHGHQLAQVASPTCQIVVVANPVLTVSRILLRSAPSLGGRVTALTALDELRAAACILNTAHRLSLPGSKPAAAWVGVTGLRAVGNHSESVWIDCSAALLLPANASQHPVRVVDALGERFLRHDLQALVRERGRDIVNGLGHTAVASTVQAIIKQVHLVLNVGSRGRSLYSAALQIPQWDTHTRQQVRLPCGLEFASLPCRYAAVSHSVIPDLRALRRALAWSPEAGRALHACRRELAIEWRMCGFQDDEQLDSQLVLGNRLLSRLALARQLLDGAMRVVVFAGAGMSTSSGISDITAFQQAFPPLHKRGVHSIFQVSNHLHFCEQPRSAWGFWAQRARDYAAASPDASYAELLALCNRATDYFVCTSNIDRLFAKAGFPEDRLYEVHGCLFDLQCTNELCTAAPYRLPSDSAFFSTGNLPVDAHWLLADAAAVPECPSCARPLRIATELAVDGQFRKDLVVAQRRKYKSFVRRIGAEDNVLLLEIGCGTAMSKLRDTANNYARVRRLRQRAGVIKGWTAHLRVNVNQSAFASQTVDDISLPLPAAQTISLLSRKEEQKHK